MSQFAVPSTRKSLVETLKEAHGGESAEFRHAYRRGEFISVYEPLFNRWCLRRGLSETEAEEVSFRILLKVFKRIDSYVPSRGLFRSWLKTVAQRVITDYRRRHVPSVGDGPLENLATPNALVELDEEIDRFDPGIALLRLALRNVEARYSRPPCQLHTWLAFEETKIKGRRAIDVAAELGVDEGVVNNAVYKIITRIKEELQRLGMEWPGMED